jgi:large subunit ribosomal protein L6
VHQDVIVEKKGEEIVVTPKSRKANQFQGLTRSILANAVHGVSEGFKTSLDLYGVGYRAELKGQTLNLSLGLSHVVEYDLPDGIKVKIETIDEGGLKRPRVHLESHDKSLLGQVASRIKSFRPPEPYKGKGVRFTGERIREKAGKAGKGA